MDFGIYGHSVYINANKMFIIGGISTFHEINDAGRKSSVVKVD
jgi:hypothetical protein